MLTFCSSEVAMLKTDTECSGPPSSSTSTLTATDMLLIAGTRTCFIIKSATFAIP